MKIQMSNLNGEKLDEASPFSEEYLLERPLLAALRSGRAALLVGEVEEADEQFEAFLLKLPRERRITIPELGAVKAPEGQELTVFPTSNRF